MTDLSNPIYNDEEKARAHVESVRWPDGPVCPYCKGQERVKTFNGKSMGRGWYHCGGCRKKFTVRVGTVYERSHIPLHKWVLATHLMCASKKGMSAHQLHRMLGITYKSAWFMAHRIRESMKNDDPEPMGGSGKVIEADETYFGSKKGLTKLKHKRGPVGKRAVVALVERGGSARSFHVASVNSVAVREILVRNASRESELNTDESSLYMSVGEEFASHYTVHHSSYQYVHPQTGAHTNTIEGFFSIFKRGMKGIYQHCGEQHLKRYLVEFDFRYNGRAGLGITDTERTVRAIKGAEGKRLTYQQPRRPQA